MVKLLIEFLEPFFLNAKLPEYVNDLKNRMQKFHSFLRSRLQVATDRMKMRFDEKVLNRPPGSFSIIELKDQVQNCKDLGKVCT